VTDSGTGNTTSRVGDRQPHNAANPAGEPRPEADVGSQPVAEPASEVAKRSPWYARIARALPHSTGWIATILVGSLLVPAITKQWSDRPRELEIKTTLIREISELTTDTVTAHVMELRQATPTARLLQARDAALANAKANASKADIADAQRKYDAALDAKLVETQTTHAQKYLAWSNKGAAVRAQLLAYFSGTHLVDDWDALSTAVVSYILLGTGNCGRSGLVNTLRSYFGSDESVRNVQWQLLEKSYYVDSQCYVGDAQSSGFLETYDFLGSQLMLKQQKMLDTIMQADMVGFSKGWRDLLNDVISGGS
jgi:hypothetical protein